MREGRRGRSSDGYPARLLLFVVLPAWFWYNGREGGRQVRWVCGACRVWGVLCYKRAVKACLLHQQCNQNEQRNIVIEARINMRWYIGIIIAIVLLCSSQVFALDDAFPGKSLEGIRLGMPRLAAYTIIIERNKYGAGWKHSAVYHYADGLMEDDLDLHSGDDIILKIEILSRNGSVVQISRTSDQQLPQTNYTFGQLKKKHPLQEKSYDLDWSDGGSIEGYYFDDVRHGVCFVSQSQDIFFLSEKPVTIIVHKMGSPVVPITQGARGKSNHSEGGRVYADEKDYSKQMEHDKNDY